MTLPRTRPRYPDVAPTRPHYESIYLKACDPAGGLGVWIRHTVFRRAGARPIGSVWLTLFDARNGPTALKQTFAPEQLASDAEALIRIAGCTLTSTAASGDLHTEAGSARWKLTFPGENSAPPFQYLSRPWMYAAPLPRTKPTLPYPAVAFTGTLELGDRRIQVDHWPGMIGHNWGAEHPHRAIWIQGTNFAEQPQARIDVVLARVKVGPWITPWVGNGAIVVDRCLHRLGGLRPGASTIDESPTGARFCLRGRDITVRGEVGAPAERFIGWRYSDPSTGHWHPTVHCSIADMQLSIIRSEAPETRLTLAGGAAYELQLQEYDHGIPLQPFPDP